MHVKIKNNILDRSHSPSIPKPLNSLTPSHTSTVVKHNSLFFNSKSTNITEHQLQTLKQLAKSTWPCSSTQSHFILLLLMVGGFERNRKLLLGAHLQQIPEFAPLNLITIGLFLYQRKNNYIIKEPTVNWIGHLNDSTTFSMVISSEQKLNL